MTVTTGLTPGVTSPPLPKASPKLPPVVIPNVLYHYTCTEHGEAGIRKRREVLPRMQPMLGYPLLWLTDLDTPDRWALGLTSSTPCCDRTEVRVSVASHGNNGGTTVVPWWFYARNMVDRYVRDLYEDTGLPLHWWVSLEPVAATAMIATSVLAAMPRKRVDS